MDCLRKPAYIELHDACKNGDYKKAKRLLKVPDANLKAL